MTKQVIHFKVLSGFPGGSVSKESAGNAGDLGSIPGWGRSPGKGNGSPLQYSRLEDPMDRGALWTIVQLSCDPMSYNPPVTVNSS